MKKVLSILLIILILGCFVGCESIPEGMPEHTYKIGVKALEVTDKYLDLEISREEAEEEMEELYERISDYYDMSKDEKTLGINLFISSIYTELYSVNCSDSEIIESRNNLAIRLDKPTRDYY